jgi:two-component sensor histidine kinase
MVTREGEFLKKKLIDCNRRFKSIINRSLDGIIILCEEGKVCFSNPAALELFGRTEKELIGKDFGFPATAGENTEIEILSMNGEYRTVEMRVTETEWEEKPALLLELRDITEQKHAKEEMKRSLIEKELLLREVHHRVKNNLNIIISLLNLHAREVEDNKRAYTIFNDCKNRIRAMAIVHEQLYKSDKLATINIRDYVRGMIHEIREIYSVYENVEIEEEIAEVALDINTAIPCGMILNELLTNSMKHAFSENKGVYVIVRFQTDENRMYSLSVQDNGPGLPDGFSLGECNSLGLTLVQILSEQLQGQFITDEKSGTFIVRFPRDRNETF